LAAAVFRNGIVFVRFAKRHLPGIPNAEYSGIKGDHCATTRCGLIPAFAQGHVNH